MMGPTPRALWTSQGYMNDGARTCPDMLTRKIGSTSQKTLVSATKRINRAFCIQESATNGMFPVSLEIPTPLILLGAVCLMHLARSATRRPATGVGNLKGIRASLSSRS